VLIRRAQLLDGGDHTRSPDLLALVRGDQPDAEGVPNEADDIVHLEALHHLAAMTLNGLDAELQPRGYLARPVSVSDHAQHLDLARSQLVQRATDRDRLRDRARETAEIGLQDYVFYSGANGRNRFLVVEGTADDDEWRCGPELPQNADRRTRVELREGVVRENQFWSEFTKSRSECFLGVDAFGHGRQTCAAQLVLYQLGVGFAVFQHQYTQRFFHRGENTSYGGHNSTGLIAHCIGITATPHGPILNI